ncbi:hypothetical protein [Pedobacter roseus]|uniref:Uncharacterized protein n=1 Tax=Pedobacter roseus TaxID=336820 RepID=A0A7G9QDU1_9SPHI|nr:hypothetical protein [Pedobacter roseus]QNN41516.1 hypothetical protein H9L23_20790 [Pedobacter roseus]
MPEDYQDIVLAAYKKMRDNGKLYAILPRETTTKLRSACLKVYESRHDPKDLDILATFFDVDRMVCDIQKKLNESEPDDFRPLWNHITGGTVTTEERNTDLLAWLIDLEPRPSSSYYLSADKTIKIGGISIDDLFPPTTTTTTTSTPDDEGPIRPKPIYIPRFSPRYITISCVILLLIGTTSFVAWETSTASVRMPKEDEKCMYWNEDHYEPVKCNAQIVNATIIPLNLKKLQHQRKINLSDTLTSYSLGKVWYKGFVKDHEYFTDSGAYPLDTQRVLKPLTNTILTKYTSNYRYMLTRLVWFLCAALFVSLCGIGASKTKKKIKVGNQNETSNSHIQDLLKQIAQ